MKKKVCAFCAEKAEYIDYKDVNKLKKYVTEKGKILPRRITGNCAKHHACFDCCYQKSKSYGFTALYYRIIFYGALISAPYFVSEENTYE